jgi:anthranilate synthase component 2/para-aminobenzoate synthetase component 2
MIYVIDHKDSFTHNVVHQLSLFDDVECDDFSKIDKSKLNQASTIVFSPGPGSPKDYPLTSKIYKKYKRKKKNNWSLSRISSKYYFLKVLK